MADNFPISHFFTSTNANENNNLNNSHQGMTTQNEQNDLMRSMLKTDGFNDNKLTQTPNKEVSNSNSEFEFEELKSITEEILENLRATIQPNKYKTFFESTFTVSAIDYGTIRFSVTTNFIKKMIENFYISTLTQVVSDLLGSTFNVEIEVMNSKRSLSSNDNNVLNAVNPAKQTSYTDEILGVLDEKPSLDGKDVAKAPARNAVKNTSFKIGSFTPTKDELIDEVNSEVRKTMHNNLGNKIDDKKTFNNFIVGPSNNMAHAFSVAVAKDPGMVYPQLYIYGNSGLGKTHLLHAICNHIKTENPRCRISLTTATDFMSEMIMAIQNNKSGVDKFAEFRRKYTDLVDVLIIDDIHELAGKARTQSEFFYVFNELQAKKKQLIFTSDKPPKEIDKLEDRIRTRLNSALLVDIHQPDFETRIAILKKKAFERDIYLDDEVINLIASSVKSNVRELEGKLVKLGAYSDLMNVDIDIEIAKQQLNLGQLKEEKPIDIDSIGNAVASHFTIPLGDIRGKTRKKDVAMARHIAMYMSHKILKITLEEIGEYFDNRDHSTVIHGVKKIEDLAKNDSRVSQQIYEIESSL